MPLLEVDNLSVKIGDATILRGVSLTIESGETLGIVGESGCGKSMTGYSIMGMLPKGGRVTSGSIRLDGRELTKLGKKEWLDIRGKQIALVMQDPFTSLNPMMRIGEQIAEAIRLHQSASRDAAWKQAVELLEKVGAPAPEQTASKYPHQMSGGQRQRVVIAIAFACRPKLLIADEPTTALDVTLQAQILRLLNELQHETGAGVALISHDVGVIGSVADHISVFYAGRVIESGTAEMVLRQPAHPYTQALLASLPRPGQTSLDSIAGQPPELSKLDAACAFAPRCRYRFDRCAQDPPTIEVATGHGSACWIAADVLAHRAAVTER